MEKEVIIKIEGEDWKKALDKAFKKLNKTAKIDGFRPGKASKEVFIKRYGMSSLYMEASEASLDLAYEKMIKEAGDVVIVAQPDISVSAVTDDYVEFKFVLTLKPEVKLGKYKNLGIKKEEVKVTDEEVKEALEDMRKKYIENIDKEGNVENGDIAIIDFEGFDGDKAFEGGKAENYALELGSNSFIPGFEEALIGVKKGDKKDVNVTFPKDYHAEELKGKPVVFKVLVHEVKTKVYPELDEDFFLDLGLEDVKTKEDLEKMVKETMTEQREYEAENKYVDELFEALLKETSVEVPHELIHEELDRMVEQYAERLKMQGITLEMFYKFTNSDEAALKEQVKEEAITRIKQRLLLEEVAKEEKIEITDEEADKDATTLASRYQMEKDEFLKEFGGLEMVKYDSKMRKAIEFLKENN